MRQGRNTRAGFSLAEVLVALAIAAFLAAVLTRFVSGTRMNAFKVREQMAMEILSDSLLERVAARESQPGRADGRSGDFRWRLEISPVPVYMRAISVSEKKPAQGEARQPNARGFTLSTGESSKQMAAAPPARTRWKAYRLAATIGAPSGRSHAIDTVRLLPEQSEQQPAQADQR
jgi:prepilin-type N-terminal cleavage/methylation domain-containing protein